MFVDSELVQVLTLVAENTGTVNMTLSGSVGRVFGFFTGSEKGGSHSRQVKRKIGRWKYGTSNTLFESLTGESS